MRIKNQTNMTSIWSKVYYCKRVQSIIFYARCCRVGHNPQYLHCVTSGGHAEQSVSPQHPFECLIYMRPLVCSILINISSTAVCVISFQFSEKSKLKILLPQFSSSTAEEFFGCCAVVNFQLADNAKTKSIMKGCALCVSLCIVAYIVSCIIIEIFIKSSLNKLRLFKSWFKFMKYDVLIPLQILNNVLSFWSAQYQQKRRGESQLEEMQCNWNKSLPQFECHLLWRMQKSKKQPTLTQNMVCALKVTH